MDLQVGRGSVTSSNRWLLVPSVPPSLLLLTLPPEVVSSLSLEVFEQVLDIYLWSMPEVECCTHLLAEGRRAASQDRPSSSPQHQHKRLLHHLVGIVLNYRIFHGEKLAARVSPQSWAGKPEKSDSNGFMKTRTVCKSSAGTCTGPGTSRIREVAITGRIC